MILILLVGFIFWLSDFDIGYTIYFSTVKLLHHVSMHIYSTVTVSLQFFTWFFVLYEGPRGQNDIFQICSDNKDLLFALQYYRFTVIRPEWVNIPYSCFYLSPFFQLERPPNMLFTPPVSPAQLTVGVVLTFEEGLLLSLLDFYTDFICKMAVKAVSLIPHCMDLLCSWVNADLSRLYSRDTSKETDHFLFNSYEQKGQCLCECQCV